MSIQEKELQIISIENLEPRRRQQSKSTAARHSRQKNYHKTSAGRKRRRRQKAIRKFCIIAVFIGLFVIIFHAKPNVLPNISTLEEKRVLKQIEEEGYPQELAELLERNEETLDFVKNYSKREKYKNQTIDLSDDYKEGEVPLLIQWDKRWGYEMYGDSMIGLAGCGPTCLTMAYIHFTKDLDMNPKKMAEFAEENGYHTSEGTSWNLWTEGVQRLGLYGEMLSLSESGMKAALDSGKLIVCSMAPGDFTTTGHFILIRGYDEKGFYVNDPNRKSNSEKQWDYETISPQIKNLWALYS